MFIKFKNLLIIFSFPSLIFHTIFWENNKKKSGSYIFQNFYLKNLREFNLNGLDIKSSEETKTYNDLLQKDENYNTKMFQKNVINRFYIK